MPTVVDPEPSDGVWTIIVAGGTGQRFGSPKQFETVAGRRVLDWSIRAAATVGQVVAVVPASTDETGPIATSATATVTGGSTRSGSVRCGLAAVPDDAEVVLVHDGARPLADEPLFRRVLDAVRSGALAVVPVVPVTDTLRARSDGSVVDRDGLVAVQTPQGFDAGVLRSAHSAGGEATDDAALVQQGGIELALISGDHDNVKVTTPHDLVIATALLEHRLGS